MSVKNVYKPRYKIAFQAQSKIWPYKNSRLRRFFNIRGRKLIRRGKLKRYFMAFNNMKWTIVRRYLRPFMLKRKAMRRRYKDVFYKKQQVRHFYGKVSEEIFRNFFKRFLANTVGRNKTFFSSLEFRLDMVIFRMGILPTIYACNQLIHHHGVLVNKQLKFSPHQLAKVGDLITLPEKQWSAIYLHVYLRIYYKSFGYTTLLHRQYRFLAKKCFLLKKKYSRVKRSKILAISIMQRNIYLKSKLLKNVWISYFQKLSIHFASSYNLVLDTNYKKTIFNNYIQPLENIKKDFEKFSIFLNKNSKTFQKCMRNFKVYKWRNYKKTVIKWFRFFFVTLKKLHWLTLQLKLLELKFLQYEFNVLINDKIYSKNVFLNIKKYFFKKDKIFSKKMNKSLIKIKYLWIVNELLNTRKTILIKKYNVINLKIIQYMRYFLMFRFSKSLLKGFQDIIINNENKKNIKTKKVDTLKKRKRSKKFFMVIKKYKKRRRIQIPRLKKVHIYIPSYIYFDFRTLRGVVMYAPKPNEIYYSFKAPLTQIYSFYKSRGY